MAGQNVGVNSEPDADDPILDAAHDEFSMVGIQRTSMDTVARQAGVSRATLYRRFPTKYSLLEAVGIRAGKWAGKRLARLAEGQPPQEVVVTAFVESARMFRSVPFFREMVDYAMSRYGQDLAREIFVREKLITYMIGNIAATLRKAGATMPEEELRTVAEIQLRMVMSFVLSPSRTMDFDDDKSVRKFVSTYLSPMVY
ncbi:TetR family transcriptional regulator [Mycobacteroides abscessus subsp. abscessus]|uniref:TetR family transcriptional regulator n=1 Tax=Mycobacteroides abscessus subsp. bolletii TaxID=319705 RepID=A0A9Q7SBV9_9MYCO|nr:TetR/AcrR family transcriptional regulator [Mycobacteroides abscessus]MDM1884315.1 helix-turn-helix domain containing protein [Mycobacteroides abscessus]MDM1890219.1 helix-turn-helix domain containing protein [Mycobacteroides abscessus]MDO3069082.1 helix-turn-helix domain containing protein [Mycobacteroides abscessus subsp. bolletii]MDO3199570.1 helix-turn-helix domain containing protein [Mycobacteroides abscessus subsp. abscessus]MDO3218041.1 helix-turn-helix domain containing protein [Myc